mmetsp:Transcript_51095/g.108551  ORF Transcript_51095/g.108551 Transcript_51095/m.108551 type:complete len:394 (-) Transcript_51095:588-1769(-)
MATVLPDFVDLATPAKRVSTSSRISRENSASSTTTAAESQEIGVPRALGERLDHASLHLEEQDGPQSPRLPDDWQPLDYELLDYADSLPPGFAQRVARELEVQEQTVSQLRSLNRLLLSREAAAASEAAATAATAAAAAAAPAPEAEPVTAVEAATQQTTGDDQGHDAEISTGSIPPCAEALAEGRRKAEIAENSARLEAKTKEVRKEADRTLNALNLRLKAAEEKQRQLAREAAIDAAERKELWEAEATLLRLRCKLQQKEAGRRHAERRVEQREEEDRHLRSDIANLSQEAAAYKATLAELEAMNLAKQEEELRQALRAAKAELRHRQRTAGNTASSKQPGSAPAATAAAATASTAPRSPLLVRRSPRGEAPPTTRTGRLSPRGPPAAAKK